MKRALLVALVFVALGMPAMAAQTPPSPIFEQKLEAVAVKTVTSVPVLLAEIAKKHQLQVSIDEKLDMDRMYLGEVPAGTLKSQIEFLAKQWDGSASLVGGDSVVILSTKSLPTKAKETPTATTPPPTTPPQPLPQQTTVARLPYPSLSAAVMSDSMLPITGPTWMDLRMQEYNAWAEANQAYRTFRSAQPYYFGADQVYSDAYYQGGYGGGLMWGNQLLRIKGAATHGYLKINAIGDTKFIKYVVVLRQDTDGVWITEGSAGKSFRDFHEPIELPVGRWRLRFELRRDGVTKYLEEVFNIESKYDLFHPKQYAISEEMMRSFGTTEAIIRR
ncbi:MAG: hypothetical protein A3B10_02805 [Candidatus Doudnabacteria bacterium RIFCSPLOWO2_01_FULL_44_21]|uniref:Secretin/TonB short N-terminal domain-containing protein n=1 Tax=Candidatus Doudnabacteria bacterium RIFCSPLOWO2_01_FULL_44_21 TaxID=1817841 RepID=A0A1F5Q271_9BACT|nr:MAG: hypothetical protein A3B95_03075 [Candidatus Doudnabacteria bacterium RIFCSPHIGHO2_02_FULL_43_13b]OGE96217.1 MAG: hypothetical protein A3B10_02805 [Candidatus Doudnabacteria bacterium RIFCSPLOWO2_01_FULL_44_21]